LQKKGHFAVSPVSADTDTVRAATVMAAMIKDKRIV
jgi:hypothetical protein